MNELYHWGIKGQKWGDRRFQNYDGSLTTAGRLRYGVGSSVRGGVFDSSKRSALSLSKGLSKVKSASNTARYKAARAKSRLERSVGTQKRIAAELKNRAKQLDYYSKKNGAVKQIMQRYADVAYLSDRRFETRATAGRKWVSNVLRPLQGNNRYDSPRRLLSRYAPVTRDMQGSFNATVKGKHHSAKKIYEKFGVWPNQDDNYRKSWY